MNKNTGKISILVVAAIASFLTPFMGSSINIALPAIASDFKANAILLSWIPTSFFLASAMFSIPLGRTADIYGMKKIFLYGVLIFTVSSLLSGMATSTIMLIVFRVIQGMGSAMIFVTVLAIIISVFPPGKRGMAIGINSAAVFAGLSLGPVLGGFLTQYFGWRSIFYLAVPLGLLVTVLIWSRLRKREWAGSRGEPFDFKGAVIYSFSLLMFICGFSMINTISGGLMVLSGIIGLVTFIIWELRVKHPVLDMKLFFKNRMFALSNLAAFINVSALISATFLLSLYLQYIKGLDPLFTGLILVTQPLIMVLVAPLAGKLSDSFKPVNMASLGMALTSAGLFLFVFLNQNTSLYFVILGLVMLGLGMGLFSSPNTNAVMGSVETRLYGVASATIGTMRITGQTFGLGIALLIFSLYLGTAQFMPGNYPALLESIKTAFLISSILCFGGIFASMARK